jgi:rSAM/selenodomain-associated transferase 1
MRRSIVVLGKPPRPGATKTRLVPPLSFQEAASLYRAFLRDTVAMALGLDWASATLVHPADPTAAPALRAILPSAIQLQAQAGEGLGAALAGAFEAQFQAGCGPVVLIGSDTPTLPPELLDEAASALRSHDLVVGPSADGGYYLIGMTKPHPGLFDRITWSTSIVFEQTMERARAHGLRTHVLREWYDVDTVAELIWLREHLRDLSPDAAIETRRELARLVPGDPRDSRISRPVRGRPANANRLIHRVGAG